MFDKFAVSCFTTYYKAKASAKAKIEKLTSGEDGMETLETIIIVAIAVVVAGFIINFLTKGKFDDGQNNDQGLIGYLFQKIGDSISEIFRPTDTINGGATPTESVVA